MYQPAETESFSKWECQNVGVDPIRPVLGSTRTGLLGYKVGNMSLYDEWGERHVVTVVKVDRNVVTGRSRIWMYSLQFVRACA